MGGVPGTETSGRVKQGKITSYRVRSPAIGIQVMHDEVKQDHKAETIGFLVLHNTSYQEVRGKKIVQTQNQLQRFLILELYRIDITQWLSSIGM